MTTLAIALQELAPNSEYTTTDGNYSSLVWHSDASTKPTEAEVNAKIAELQAAEPLRLLREERNRLIAETDWWALSDMTMTQAQTDYRQALRDITDNYTSLDDVVWPTKP
jgi:hypothetical protein